MVPVVPRVHLVRDEDPLALVALQLVHPLLVLPEVLLAVGGEVALLALEQLICSSRMVNSYLVCRVSGTSRGAAPLGMFPPHSVGISPYGTRFAQVLLHFPCSITISGGQGMYSLGRKLVKNIL